MSRSLAVSALVEMNVQISIFFRKRSRAICRLLRLMLSVVDRIFLFGPNVKCRVFHIYTDTNREL